MYISYVNYILQTLAIVILNQGVQIPIQIPQFSTAEQPTYFDVKDVQQRDRYKI